MFVFEDHPPDHHHLNRSWLKWLTLGSDRVLFWPLGQTASFSTGLAGKLLPGRSVFEERHYAAQPLPGTMSSLKRHPTFACLFCQGRMYRAWTGGRGASPALILPPNFWVILQGSKMTEISRNWTCVQPKTSVEKDGSLAAPRRLGDSRKCPLWLIDILYASLCVLGGNMAVAETKEMLARCLGKKSPLPRKHRSKMFAARSISNCTRPYFHF